MDRSIVIALYVIVASAIAYYFWQEREARNVMENRVELPRSSTPLPAPGEDTGPAVRYPVPPARTAPDAPPAVEPVAAVDEESIVLPALGESDASMQGLLGEIYSPGHLAGIFVFREFIRHFVVTADNLTAKKLPLRYVFTRQPQEKFLVEKTDDDRVFFLDEENYRRYQPYMDFINSVDNRQLVSIYVSYYPLFQQAYEELGYPDAYFNDRLVEVVDHLLETPQAQRPVKLLRPKVYYQFADAELEKLSAGQKLLIRVGERNAAYIKSRLMEIRGLLTTLEP